MAEVENQVALPNALSLVNIEGKGRGLVASQPLKGGQVILRDSPILTYSAYPLKRRDQEGDSSYLRYCVQCCKTLGPSGSTASALTCSSCSHSDDASFCSAKCQSLAISLTHSPWACQALRYLRNCYALVDQQPDERQVQARYLVAAYNLAMYSPSTFQTLLSLEGSGTQDVDRNSAMLLNSIISSLPFPEGMSSPTVEMTASLLSKDRCNAFGLMEPFSENGGRTVRAYAIYPHASFFNHDCLPNACRFDYIDSAANGNTDMIIRMIHDVPQGREICLSYFPVNLSYPERQKRLLDDYGFSCICDRCKVEANWSHQDDEGEDETMEEDEGEMESDGENDEVEDEGNDDFPHAYFFVRFVCDKENCAGTLAPLPPLDGNPRDIMECNVCGNLKREVF
ncbi:histone-lysine N-methyltransferase ASHR2-like [Silene latifolia]|uniref:histone-lysine N-methyltransferase ASHR2-like n=1 Tax=Silene latifolia TaxID=37657 RepID=UPI003D77889F